MSTEKPECSHGWGDRCAMAKIPKCNCACGGENHGARYRSRIKKFEEYMKDVVNKDINKLEDGFIVGFAEDRSVYIDGDELDPAQSQAFRNHSPDGFNWGYGGSGPAQLAIGILLAFYKPEVVARTYQQFKWNIISGLEQGKNFKLPIKDVKKWMKDHATD